MTPGRQYTERRDCCWHQRTIDEACSPCPWVSLSELCEPAQTSLAELTRLWIRGNQSRGVVEVSARKKKNKLLKGVRKCQTVFFSICFEVVYVVYKGCNVTCAFSLNTAERAGSRKGFCDTFWNVFLINTTETPTSLFVFLLHWVAEIVVYKWDECRKTKKENYPCWLRWSPCPAQTLCQTPLDVTIQTI